MLYRPKHKESILVDLSPLIDVVFLLLIFFMVSTRFKDDHGLDLDLPESESRQQAQTEELLSIFVGRDGEIRLGEEPIELSALETRVREALPRFEKKMVVLKVDKNVNHGLVIEVMDRAKAAGASGLSFGTLGRKKAPSP